MDALYLGIGTRLQHTHFGPGVVVGIRYATYLISFIHHGLKEIEKGDAALEEIIPENVTEEIETHSDVEKKGWTKCGGDGFWRRSRFFIK